MVVQVWNLYISKQHSRQCVAWKFSPMIYQQFALFMFLSTGRFNLDFTDTRDLFREIEDLCGYDFKQQVGREFQSWYGEMLETAKQMNGDSKDLLEHLDEILDTLKKIAKGKAFDKEELQDAIDELNDFREEYNDYTDWASEFNYILTGKDFNN